MSKLNDLELGETREIARRLAREFDVELPPDFSPEHVQDAAQRFEPGGEGRQSKLALALQVTGSRLAQLGDGLTPVARELVLSMDGVAQLEREGTELHDRLTAATWAALQEPTNGSYGPSAASAAEIRAQLERFNKCREEYLSMLWEIPRYLRRKGLPKLHYSLPPDQANFKSRLTSILDREHFSDSLVRDLTEPFAAPGKEKRRALNTVKKRRGWTPKHRTPTSFTVPDTPEMVEAAEKALKRELRGKPQD